MSLTAVNRDRLREPGPADRFLQQPERRLFVPGLRQQKVNRLTVFVHGAIQGTPRALHLNIRLVHPPAHPYRTLVPMERLFQGGTVFDDPALDGGVVDWDPALLHEFFAMPVVFQKWRWT